MSARHCRALLLLLLVLMLMLVLVLLMEMETGTGMQPSKCASFGLRPAVLMTVPAVPAAAEPLLCGYAGESGCRPLMLPLMLVLPPLPPLPLPPAVQHAWYLGGPGSLKGPATTNSPVTLMHSCGTCLAHELCCQHQGCLSRLSAGWAEGRTICC